MARSDEIDELVSSVRNLVAHKDAGQSQEMAPLDRLILTPALRVDMSDDAPHSPTNTDELAEVGVLVLDNAVEGDQGSLEATIAELEAAVMSQPDDWEPDGGETLDQAAWTASAFQPPQSDSAAVVVPEGEADKAGTPQSEQDEAIADASQPDLAARIADDIVMQDIGDHIDEAALRAMVLGILRAELAGEMGERITRNVRKLVRREINRVLTSRDMD